MSNQIQTLYNAVIISLWRLRVKCRKRVILRNLEQSISSNFIIKLKDRLTCDCKSSVCCAQTCTQTQ